MTATVHTQIGVEVVFATAESQVLLSATLPEGATVADALSATDLERRFPDTDFDGLQAGVWGQPVARNHVLSDGDRVEVYRPLTRDPKEARRQLANLGLTMGKGAKD